MLIHKKSHNEPDIIKVSSKTISKEIRYDPITLHLIKYRIGKCAEISFIDSTTLDVCD